MAEKIIRNNLHELLEEIRKTEGIPENLETEAQLWDEILKREAFVMPAQIFPLIEEVHGRHYEKDTPIRPLATEFSVERSEEGKIGSIRADITLLVDNKDIYHFEVEIENDGTMVLRMFEYDVHLALSYPSHIPSDSSGSSKLALTFPHSAVLYLQDNRNTPDYLECQIQFQDGGTYTYRVPTLKVQSYSLEAIEEKHLSVLVPFLPLRFRKKIVKDPKTGRISFKMSKEELTSFYQELILILDREAAGGQLTEDNRDIILALLRKSMIRVFHQDEELIREVVRMTEPILELEFDKYLKERDEAREQVQKVTQELETTSAELETTSAELETTSRKLETASAELETTSRELETTSAELETTSRELETTSAELETTSRELEMTSRELRNATQEVEKYKNEQAKDKELIAALQQQLAEMQKNET